MGDKIDLTHTPKFKYPPLTETVLGVQFAPIAGLQLPEYLKFGNETGRDFAEVEANPPLLRQVEEKGMGPPVQVFQLIPVRASTPQRMWFRQKPENGGEHLVQLQSDRLILNWRRLPGSSEKPIYPSYKSSRAEFVYYFEALQKFLKSRNIGPVAPDQCEVCYVNEIKVGDAFKSPAEAFFKLFDSFVPAKQPKVLGGEPENQNLNATYWCDELNGRFFIDAAIMFVAETSEPVVTLRLTVRGAPKGKTQEDVLNWLDLGHYYVVHAFKQITSETMHKRWVEEK